MNILNLLLILALVAVAVTLFAWAAVKLPNAYKPRRGRRLTKVYFLPLVWEKIRRAGSPAPRQAGMPDATGGIQFCNVGEGTHEHGRKSYLGDAATTVRYLLYEQGVTTNDYCKLAAGANQPLGPSDDLVDANALDIPITVKLLGAFMGTSRAVSDGTVTNGTLICVSKDGTGRATCPAGGAGICWVVGRAVIPSDDDAGGPVVANDDFEFIPCFPFQKTY